MQRGGTGPTEKALELIKGAVDIHIHTTPDIFLRKINDTEVALFKKI